MPRKAPQYTPVCDTAIETVTADEAVAGGAMTLADAAKFLAVSERTVVRLIAEGSLRSAKVKGRRVVLRRSAEIYLASNMED